MLILIHYTNSNTVSIALCTVCCMVDTSYNLSLIINRFKPGSDITMTKAYNY